MNKSELTEQIARAIDPIGFRNLEIMPRDWHERTQMAYASKRIKKARKQAQQVVELLCELVKGEHNALAR